MDPAERKPSLSASDIIRASHEAETDSQCRSCVNLLQEVLQNVDAKPSRILASLFADPTATTSLSEVPSALNCRSVRNGIEVEVPVAPPPSGRAKTNQSSDAAPHRNPLRRWSLRVSPSTPATPADVTASSHNGTSRGNDSSTPMTGVTSTVPASLPVATSAVVPDRPAHEDRSQGENVSAHHATAHPPTEWLSIRCQPCKMTGPEAGARAFVMGPKPLSIVVCTNRLKHGSSTHTPAPAAIDEMDEILTHELIHVYDVRQLQLDLRQCESLAYSEVRAARDAECRNYYEGYDTAARHSTNGRGLPSWYTLHRLIPNAVTTKRDCASYTAQTATSNLFPNADMAKQCVNRVFERAFADQRPFATGQAKESHTREG